MRTTILALPIFFLVATMAFGQPGERQRGQRPDGPRGQRASFVKDLQLTDAQEGQFKKLQLDHQRKQTQTESKITLARLDLRELFQADKPDRGAIEKGMRAVSDLQFQAKTNHLDHWFAVYNILTPEQQVTWKEHFEGRGFDGTRPMRHFGDRMRGRMRD
jgi:Spy/CpxP family protein refolding chaperone